MANVCQRASSKPRKACIPYSLVRSFAPARGLELGTCLGISTASTATAMRLNGHGAMVPLEGAPSFGEIARRTFTELGLTKVEVCVGRFHDTLPACSSRRQSASPTSTTTTRRRPSGYHGRIRPRLAQGAIVGFDDVAWSAGMARAWAATPARPSNALSVELAKYGVCVSGS